MRILVVGATGVLGRNVIPRLLERGHHVRAVARRAEQVEALQRVGVDALPGDILDEASLLAAARGCDAALHLATAIPTRLSQRADWSLNDSHSPRGHAPLAHCRRAGRGAPLSSAEYHLYLWRSRPAGDR